MPLWKPEPILKDQEVFIIGGGPSLRSFDWSLLENENTIGCNNAFRLGPKVCKICVFVDRKFIFDAPNHPRKGFYDELAKFPGTVITNDSQLKTRHEPWILWMQRRPRGLHYDALGFNANCGATAINVALLLGATTIYLLGIDMHLGESKEPNWHEHLIDKPSEEVYGRMLASFGWVRKDLELKFPGRKVFNVNANSNLNIFPKLDPKTFWEERRKNGRINQTDGGVSGCADFTNTTVDSDFEKGATGFKITGRLACI